MSHQLVSPTRPANIDIKRIRHTQAWRKLARTTCQREPICWLHLPGCTIRSTTGDHIIPISIRPDLALAQANIRGACKNCNYRRGNTPVNQLDQLRHNLIRQDTINQTRCNTTIYEPSKYDAGQQKSNAPSRFFTT